MKTLNKYFVGILFIFAFLFIGANIASADTITGDVTVTVDPVIPSVGTSGVSLITNTTARSGGEIMDNGGATIITNGVVWSTSASPTISLSTKTSDDTSSGIFTSNISSLNPGVLYHIRAYATNSAGTGYGNEITFTTLTLKAYTLTVVVNGSGTVDSDILGITCGTDCSEGYDEGTRVTLTATPSTDTFISSFIDGDGRVGSGNFTYYTATKNETITFNFSKYITTENVTNITQNTATAAGNLNCSIPSSTITSKGLVWSTSTNPTTALSTKIINGRTNCGYFSANLTSLSANTTYYVRAYVVTNNVGTKYGNEVSFKTLSSPPTGTLTGSDCTIATGASTCTTTLTLNVTNPVSGAATNVTKPTNIEVISNTVINSVFPFSKSGIVIPYLGTTFYLNHNSGTLASKFINASCSDPSAIWTGSICGKVPSVINTSATNIKQTTATINTFINDFGTPTTTTYYFRYGKDHSLANQTSYKSVSGPNMTENIAGLTSGTIYYFKGYAINSVGTASSNEGTFTTVAPPAGTLTAGSTSCIIPTNFSSCILSLGWGITNPIGIPTAITASGMTDINVTNTLATPQSGNQSVTVPYSSRSFYLYNNGIELANKTLTSDCDTANGDIWNTGPGACVKKGPYSVTTSVISDRGTANVGGTITPTPQSVYWGDHATFTVNPAAGYPTYSVTDNCGANGTKNGTLSGSTYTTGAITAACTVAVTFNTSYFKLSVSKSGTGGGVVSADNTSEIDCGSTCSHSYDYGTTVTLTAVPDVNSIFTTWNGCDSVMYGKCNVTIRSAKSVEAVFTTATISVTASPTTYNVPLSNPSPSVSFTYTATTSTGTAQCDLLDNKDDPLTDLKTNSTIVYLAPSVAGIYAYSIRCQNSLNPSVYATSGPITVNVVQPSVVANSVTGTSVTIDLSTPLTYSAPPGSTVNFNYTTSTVPSGIGSTECLLQDYAYNNATTTYQASSPISYKIVNSVGSYGYYINCRNTSVNAATVTSNLITINTKCQVGSSWNGSSCEVPTGTLNSVGCTIPENSSYCSAPLSWSITNPIGVPTAITASSITTPVLMSSYYKDVIVSASDPKSGIESVPTTYPSRAFYLYNNGEPPRATLGVTATCISGTGWSNDVKKCVKPEGKLLSGGCTIPVDGRNCNANLDWAVTVSAGGLNKVVSTPGGEVVSPTLNLLGSTTYPIDHEAPKTLTLSSGGIDITSITTNAICNNDISTWNGSICERNDAKILLFEANPTSIFKGKSSLLSWKADTNLVSSCTGTGGIGFNGPQILEGSASVSPTETTKYTLTCKGIKTTSPDAIANATTRVVNITVKEN